MSKPVVASFGGGLNSTAMLIELAEQGERVDLILFADTGGERPETYAHVTRFSAWLRDHVLPEIITVCDGRRTLEQECLSTSTLPSLALTECLDRGGVLERGE